MDDLRQLFQVMTRRFGFLNKNCCTAGGCDISLVQSHILYEISRQRRPSMQQVAETLGTDITTFSRQIQSLIKMNLVKKTPDPEDRRVSLLSLTPEGNYVTETIDQQMKLYLEEVFSHMNAFEKETVIRSIQLLNESMAKSGKCCTTPLG
ncbi:MULTISPECIES: MarR family transcriptional regulator [Brevibacillus]|uniref:MarR family transcriptional regulator n=1 Tax=Brevibacillus invocatus TaxID=173959 RepID=A0A3M8CBP2_9BACL|nr:MULTISPECIES: MarR family transcriptional regulator [Brevibacillus]MCM3080187.1 MarR family transcriptional regulator [Brevibacillus invocatus]MCM3430367.1 MarR family transcriptional regulator [Brevibacillus invocatus]MDH4619171.1 MarR family transcriptional regulator [Brevibacillus sp. AY1]RNB73162.1 MarR family transcriptional regulator [Brevibacillus invocatus]